MKNVQKVINDSVKKIDAEVDFDIFRPDVKFGDFSTNAALVIGRKQAQDPLQIAQAIKSNIENMQTGLFEEIEIVKPGFVNVRLKEALLHSAIKEVLEKKDEYGRNNKLVNKVVLVEYLDPNPFKEIHIGHAYSGTVGDCIALLFEASGAKVHRVTYQGDVGLHVAKATYGILKKIGGDPKKLTDIAESDRPKFLGETYSYGALAYDESDKAKVEINEINKKIYENSDDVINQIHRVGVSWSMQYFEETYKLFDFTPFEKNYLEGMVAKEGLKLVKEHITDGVFEESDGAIVFRGEKFGLHTRVFINSQGLPTYDAKDLGNAALKWRDYAYDKSIIITGNEQTEYFKVMLKALEQFSPKEANNTTHIPHGMVVLSQGKMSSRTGDVIAALDLLNSVESSAKKMANSPDSPTKSTALAAIKYAFLKNKIGGNIVYNVNESLSLEGNSGPYLQYSYARACSILDKKTIDVVGDWSFDEREKNLALRISQFPEVIDKATEELTPHLICAYLYELAQAFNSFYEKNRVIGSDKESQRLALVEAYACVLKKGLKLLKIPTPKHI